MKLLFTQDALVNAGAERSHLEILSRFSEDVDVGFVYFYPKHDLKEAYERAGFRLFFLDIPESYHFVLAVRKLVKLIRQEKPDLLVSSLWRADIITRFASWFTGVPLVGTLVNDSYAPIAWTDKKGIKYKIVYWLDRLTAGIPIHWIANAQALANSHVKTLGIDRDKVSVVYRGRPLPVIAPARSGGSAAKQSFKAINSTNETASAADGSEVNSDFPNSSLAVTDDVIARTRNEDEAISKEQNRNQKETASPDFVRIAVTSPIRNFISYGRLLERKGFQDAIHAFAAVQKKYPDCTLTIFGEGSYRKELESLILELGLQNSVFLPGKISNPFDVLIHGFHLSEAYCPKQRENENVTSNSKIASDNVQRKTYNLQPKKAHCFLFPSWYEGFSGALVEAMMAGIPIIASNIPMNLEAVEDQRTALVSPVQDVNALSKQMTWAIENPEAMQALGMHARKVAEERFDIEKIAMQYERVLMEVFASHRK